MFDEFLDELRRRQAEAENGGKPNGESHGAGSDPEDEGSRKDATMRSDEPDSEDTDRDDDGPASPIFGRGGFRGGTRRYAGGSGDMPEIHVGRGWIVLGILALLVVVLMSFFALTVGLATDAIWFQSVGFGNVFWTRLGTQILFFVAGAVVAFALLWFNIWLAGRFIPKGQLRQFSLDDLLNRFSVERYLGGDSFGSGPFGPSPKKRTVKSDSVTMPDVGRPVFWSLLTVALLVALAMGGLALSGWDTIQLFIHRVPYGQVDPTFGKDIGFFLFELPFYRLVQSFANSLLLVALALVAIRYLVAVASGASMPTTARVHIGILAALWLWSAAIGYQLDRYELVYSGTSGIFQGVSFTDANARMLAMNVMTVLTAFIGCFVVGFTFTRWRTPLVLTLVFWAGAFLVLEVGYPQLVQRLQVEPNQQAQESTYISDNIQETRLAFNLTSWTSSTTSYTPQVSVTKAAVTNESSTIQNVRLWDSSPLGQTLDGLQVLKQYYTFPSVTTDRYVFTDKASCSPSPPPCVRQVMLSGRELDPTQLAQLSQGDQSWVNQHIVYTHGYGVVMVPVNEVASSGQPNLLISNFPPSSTQGVTTVTQPRIYFGTQSSNYVIVDAASQEFDYPSASGSDQKTSWTGTTGIKLDTPLSRLLFAARFGDLNMLISSQITGSSQLLYNRSIQERVAAIAPFLRYDKDPYLVLTANGSLDYVLDAYTTSAAFPDANPYSPPSTSGLAGDSFNYVRNSVKVVMNAYDGTMSFYVADPKDPIIQAWEGVFPGLFKPISEMPVDIRGDATNPGHLRYPADMFAAQTAQYAKYHVTDPSDFFQNNDVWSVPPSADSGGTTGTQQLGLQAYYLQMRIPGQANPEFVLVQPMLPQGRQNMIAWVAAHNDPSDYGEVSVFDFPKETNVLGPQQIQALIAQNKDISQQITLWGQVGSKVILGNLLVVPLQDSSGHNQLLYVEPVYLQASSNGLPIFQKVILATQTQTVWGNSLEDALNQIYAGQGTTTSGGTPSPGASSSPSVAPSSTAKTTAAPTATGTPGALPSVSLTASEQELVTEANAHFQAAQAAAGRGDWTTYGNEMQVVSELLARLQQEVGTAPPSSGP
jgi:uncharacterized membrane protein (UPF0182 family)